MTQLGIGPKAERETMKAFMKCFFVLLVASGDTAKAGGLASVPINTQEASERKRQIIVSIPDRKLVLMEDARVVRIYPVAIGAAVSPSPKGSFQLISKVTDPTYYHSGKVIPPGRSNPLGNRWLGFSKKGYGIHGTNVPSSVGKAASHGCIRMGKHDVEELFTLVRVGDEVEIHGERDARIRGILGNSVEAAATPDRQATRPGLPAVSAVAMAVAAGAL
jgi:L,D-transpeptidase-like protein